jgi:cytochrome c-type biogenesis protein CcmH/NrfF
VLLCIFRDCGHKNLAECSFSRAARMREELAQQVALGKGRDEINAWFVEQYGSQEPLGAPIDRGFNRLAWLVPYLVGGAGLLGVAIVVGRWKREGTAPVSAETASAEKGGDADSALTARLDDELRDLD